MANFSNMDELLKAINNTVKEAVVEEVPTEIKKTVKKHKQSDVYDLYDPFGKNPYERRYDQDGGFLNEDNTNIDIKNTSNEINITVTDETKGVGDAYNQNIIGIIEEGHPYTWHPDHQPGARPFIEKTTDELKNGTLEDTLKKALKAKGLDIK